MNQPVHDHISGGAIGKSVDNTNHKGNRNQALVRVRPMVDCTINDRQLQLITGHAPKESRRRTIYRRLFELARVILAVIRIIV